MRLHNGSGTMFAQIICIYAPVLLLYCKIRISLNILLKFGTQFCPNRAWLHLRRIAGGLRKVITGGSSNCFRIPERWDVPPVSQRAWWERGLAMQDYLCANEFKVMIGNCAVAPGCMQMQKCSSWCSFSLALSETGFHLDPYVHVINSLRS